MQVICNNKLSFAVIAFGAGAVNFECMAELRKPFCVGCFVKAVDAVGDHFGLMAFTADKVRIIFVIQLDLKKHFSVFERNPLRDACLHKTVHVPVNGDQIQFPLPAAFEKFFGGERFVG